MKHILFLFCMVALAAPAFAGPAFTSNVAITVHYGNGQQMTFVGPPDDTFCIARSTGLKLNADRIDVPAGNYKLQCPETVFDPKFRWTPASQAVGPETTTNGCGTNYGLIK